DTGCGNGCAGAYWSRPAPYSNSAELQFAVSRSQVIVESNGSPVAHISSGRDLLLHADVLENNASHILATNNAILSGNTLNNQSWIESIETHYLSYAYGGSEYATESSITSQNGTGGMNSIYFVTTGDIRTESTDGDIFRSVIQAGGNVIANFTQDISNTTTTANAGGTSNIITAPTLNRLSQPDGVQQQDLANADSADITSPQWYESLTEAVAHIAGGNSLYPLPSDNN
ncbi:hypothetical protein RYA60_22790, partial [Pseudomonas syringae]|nr:hypothetical protein [Pseudomonas syringae]